MIQELIVKKITRNCFSTHTSRLIFTLIANSDFCTRNELLKWTNYSSITISRYLQEFSKQGLIGHAPGIVFISDFGKNIFDSLQVLLKNENELTSSILLNEKNY